ncbi:RNA-binding S4 domain-containing protein [Legionella worsleiensis]|uniref:Putative RNA-binding protein n=1 Tax=Legionella worsleiensis TaxID=45076 RepID=A0A0W1AFV3_9GAMM|nr:RNA-binding S4 domain-containing protein [Legionella worsleiensis]KTD80223.1 putative RNA-binding protein [Legionella worsleiensis]STY31699.1 putative RNA-binding protein [Legionella worsleiensis]
MTGVINNMKDVFINKEYVELFKILKFEGIASSGAEAKDMIASGTVLVNGLIEKQKRKKMVAGDTIEVKGEIFRLKSDAD